MSTYYRITIFCVTVPLKKIKGALWKLQKHSGWFILPGNWPIVTDNTIHLGQSIEEILLYESQKHGIFFDWWELRIWKNTYF